jgi:hypothetical protein
MVQAAKKLFPAGRFLWHANKSWRKILLDHQVPDWSLAAYLQEILSGSKVERLDIGIVDEARKKRGRCRKHKSNRERVAKQRQRAREEKLRLLAAQLGLNAPDTNGKNLDLEEDGTSCAENGIKLYTKIGTQRLTATIYSSVSSSMPKARRNSCVCPGFAFCSQ